MGKWIAIIALGILVVIGFSCAGSYNSLVTLDQAVQSQWGQVENAYQRRLDLVPNLVETVKGAAAFEKDTFTAVAQARNQAAAATAAAAPHATENKEALRQFEGAQDQLTGAISRLLVVVERYPELKATEAFRDL